MKVALSVFLSLGVVACGARTGLPVEGTAFDAGVRRDASAPRDAGTFVDAGASVDASVPDDAAAIVAALDGLRWELPCTEPRYDNHICTSALETAAMATVRGPPGALYDVTARFRGVVELKTYVGGAVDGNWSAGGLPADDSWNVYDLAVSDPTFVAFINAGDSGLFICTAIDFTQTFRVASGATVRLIAGSLNELEVENWDGAGTIRVPDVAPYPATYDGQFAQMDVVSIVRVR